MKILASKREYPTYEDYKASGEYSDSQLATIGRALEQGVSPRAVSLLANPEFTPDQMEVILDGLVELPLGQVASYADPNNSYKYMRYMFRIYSENIPDEVISLVENYTSNEDLRYNLIRRYGNRCCDEDTLRRYLNPKYPEQFIFYLADQIGSDGADAVLTLYDKYPKVLEDSNIYLAYNLNNLFDELGFFDEFRDLPHRLLHTELSDAQMAYILECIEMWDAGDLPLDLLYSFIDPNMSVEDMEHEVEAWKNR